LVVRCSLHGDEMAEELQELGLGHVDLRADARMPLAANVASTLTRKHGPQRARGDGSRRHRSRRRGLLVEPDALLGTKSARPAPRSTREEGHPDRDCLSR
jgi:hypothetical protein